MYNPITIIKSLYKKLFEKQVEIRENEDSKLIAAMNMLQPKLDERRRLQAYCSTYRAHFANNPGFR